jgi:uncharacterized membrane protein YhaH (DUF805 family)
MDFRKLLLSPHGRIGRQSYWLSILFIVITGAITGALDAFVFGNVEGDGPLSRLLSIVSIYPAMCLQTKRLHDHGRSGWLQLLPLGAIALSAPLLAAGVAGAVGFVLIVLCVGGWMFIWLGFIKGQPGPNKYGEPNSGDRDVTPQAEVFS